MTRRFQLFKFFLMLCLVASVCSCTNSSENGQEVSEKPYSDSTVHKPDSVTAEENAETKK